jgi:Protein of unknown function (DUF3040)
VEFRILGPLDVVEDGQPLALAAGKQRSLLAMLLLHANNVVSRRHADLGLEPRRELQDLERAILRHDPELARPVRPALEAPRPLRRPRVPILMGLVLLSAALAAGLVELLGSATAGGLSRVRPDALGAIAAPLVAFGNETWRDFFSARVGCQLYRPVLGMDLGALCIEG